MKRKTVKRIVLIGVLIMALGITALPAFAADEVTPDPQPAPQLTGDGVRRFFSGILTRTFRYQTSMTLFIGYALENAQDLAENAYARIQELESVGKDTTRLTEAVDTFEDLYAGAAENHQSALELVDEHSGFDLRGKVVDLADARETVRAIEPYLTAAREAIVEAVQVIHDAVKEFQEANQS